MKKFALLVIVGLVLLGALVFSGGRQVYEAPFTLTITGVASGVDSIVLDTIELPFDTKHRLNRVIGSVVYDSIKNHDPSGSMLLCTLMTVLKTEFAGITTMLDSTKLTQASNVSSTHNFFEGAVQDSLFGERLYLILRLADTVGVTTDSVTTITGRIRILHAFD